MIQIRTNLVGVLIICFLEFAIGDITVGVVNFSSNATNEMDYTAMTIGAAESISAKLINIPGIIPVELSHQHQINSQIARGQTGLVDEATAATAGKQLGAKNLIVGSWFKMGKIWRLTAKLIDVEMAQVISACNIDGKLDDMVSMIDQVPVKLFKRQFAFSDDVLSELKQPETKSVDAFKNYSMAVKKAEYQNDKINAETFARKALKLDPDYKAPLKYIYRFWDEEQGAYIQHTDQRKIKQASASVASRDYAQTRSGKRRNAYSILGWGVGCAGGALIGNAVFGSEKPFGIVICGSLGGLGTFRIFHRIYERREEKLEKEYEDRIEKKEAD